tara:strand:+ start:514 stop:981 length:468 start_codon:yes stop_codon:yes gene_type:complete
MIDSDFKYLDKDQKNKFLYKEKKLLIYKKSNENLDVSILMNHLDEDVIYSSNGIISDVTGRENISTFLINRYKYHKKFSTYKKRNLKRAYAHGLIEKHPFLNFKFEPCLSLEINTINCGYILLNINEFNLIEKIMTVDVPIQSIQFVDSFIIENN